MKMFEPAMRHLLDTYIRADESERLAAFDDMSLVELIVEREEDAMESLPENIRKNKEAMAETIENNVRKLIIDEMPVNPRYYERMSELLDAIIKERRRQALEYKEYLRKIVELAKKVKKPECSGQYPEPINTAALRALYDNIEHPRSTIVSEKRPPRYGQRASRSYDPKTRLALRIDRKIREVKKDDWRGNKFKEREVRNAIRAVVGDHPDLVDKLFEIVKNQRDY